MRAAWGLGFGLVAALTGCEGYAELPIALRERGALTVVSVERFVGGPGRVEVRLEPPGDALGPFVVVGHPGSLTSSATVESWAVGRCSGEVAGPLSLCLSVRTSSLEPLVLAAVVESRGDGRRFTLLGEEGASP